MESESEEEGSSCNSKMKKLKLFLKEQRRKVRKMSEVVHVRDERMEALLQDVEVKDLELKRLEKSHRILTERLNEERQHYLLEKTQFCQEMLRTKRRVDELEASAKRSSLERVMGVSNPTDVQQIKTFTNQTLYSEISALRKENEKLRSIIEVSDEQNHELCERFLRMQQKKEMIWEKLREVDDDFITSLKNLMIKFNELREEYNLLVDDGFLTGRSSKQDKQIKMAQTNCNMAYENSCLKLELQSLKRDINYKIYSTSGWKEKIATAEVGVQTEKIDMAQGDK